MHMRHWEHRCTWLFGGQCLVLEAIEEYYSSCTTSSRASRNGSVRGQLIMPPLWGDIRGIPFQTQKLICWLRSWFYFFSEINWCEVCLVAVVGITWLTLRIRQLTFLICSEAEQWQCLALSQLWTQYFYGSNRLGGAAGVTSGRWLTKIPIWNSARSFRELEWLKMTHNVEGTFIVDIAGKWLFKRFNYL